MSVWDFQLVFGLASSESPEQVTIRNHQAIFLSPQQAKALWNVLGQNIAPIRTGLWHAESGAAEPELPARAGELGDGRPAFDCRSRPLRFKEIPYSRGWTRRCRSG